MKEFQAMPLRFRVWDKELRCFIQYKDIYDSSYDQSKTELDIIDLAHYLYNTDEKPENIVISQDTGLKDKNGKSIFTGDIIKVCRSYGYGFLPKGSVGAVLFDQKELCIKISNNGQYRLTANKKCGSNWQHLAEPRVVGGRRTMKIGFISLLQIVFIVLKILGVINWSWLWVLSPFWISLIVILAIFIILVIKG